MIWAERGIRAMAKKDGTGHAVLWVFHAAPEATFTRIAFKVRAVTSSAPRPKVQTFPAAKRTAREMAAEMQALRSQGFYDWSLDGGSELETFRADFAEGLGKVFGRRSARSGEPWDMRPRPIRLHCNWQQICASWVPELDRIHTLSSCDSVAAMVYRKLYDALEFPSNDADRVVLGPRPGSFGALLLARITERHPQHAWLEDDRDEEASQRIVLDPESPVFRLWGDLVQAPTGNSPPARVPRRKLAIF